MCVCAFFHWAHYYRLKNYKQIIYAWIILSWEIIILLYMWKNHTFIVTLVYCVPYLSNAYCIRITQYIFACVSTAHVSEKSQYILFFYLALSLSLPTERTRNIVFVSICLHVYISLHVRVHRIADSFSNYIRKRCF